MKERLKNDLIVIGVAAFIFAVGYFIWFSPTLLLYACIIVLFLIIYRIFHLSFEDNGCLNGILVLLIFVALYILFHEKKYYITDFNNYKHLYCDCDTKSNFKGHRVSNLDCSLWLCTEECPKCKKRKEIEHKEFEKKIEKMKAEQRIEDIKFIQRQIDELLEVKASLEKGEDIEASDYEFRYQSLDYLESDLEPDPDQDSYYVPSRYR